MARDANPKEVRRAYLSAAKRLHPDRLAQLGLLDLKDGGQRGLRRDRPRARGAHRPRATRALRGDARRRGARGRGPHRGGGGLLRARRPSDARRKLPRGARVPGTRRRALARGGATTRPRSAGRSTARRRPRASARSSTSSARSRSAASRPSGGCARSLVARSSATRSVPRSSPRAHARSTRTSRP